MIGIYNYTVIVTYCSLIAASLGMYFASQGSFRAALISLIISGLCDMVDGPISRTRKRTETEKKFGIQIDSLCDLVSFGIQPAAIVYFICAYNCPDNKLIKIIALVIGIIFALCAVIRLAYFNVTEEERQATEGNKLRTGYQGLPVTNSSLIMPIAYLTNYFLDGVALACVMMFFLAATAFLFVYNFRMFKLHGKKLIPVGIAGALVVVALIFCK